MNRHLVAAWPRMHLLKRGLPKSIRGQGRSHRSSFLFCRQRSPASPLRSVGFRWLMLFRICTLLSKLPGGGGDGRLASELTRDPWSLGRVGWPKWSRSSAWRRSPGYLVDHLPRRKLGAAACRALAINAGARVLIAHGALPLRTASMAGRSTPSVAVGGVDRSFSAGSQRAVRARAQAGRTVRGGASMGSVVKGRAWCSGPALGVLLVGVAGKSVSYARPRPARSRRRWRCCACVTEPA